MKAEAADRKKLTPLQRAATVLGPALLRLLFATWRVRSINADKWLGLRRAKKPFVFAMWHGQMLPLVVQHRREGVKVLISEHRDGELIAQIVTHFGFGTIRGSSSRGAARALLAMCETLESGGEIAVTPDGPRGPARRFASGALVAAHRAGTPIVAVGVSATRAWRLKSWDAFMIPKPFATVTFAYGDPMHVDAADSRAAALQTDRFEAALNAAVELADGAGAAVA